jgi:hypothetical protein
MKYTMNPVMGSPPAKAAMSFQRRLTLRSKVKRSVSKLKNH